MNTKTLELTLLLAGAAIASGCSMHEKLGKMKSAEFPSLAGAAKADGSLCSLAPEVNASPAKVIFVVDMSASNYENPGASEPMFAPSDPTGTRFQAIQQFLSSECSRKNPKNKFAVVGFSSTALVQGATTTDDSACNSGVLGTVDKANQQLDYLRQIQTGTMNGSVYNVMTETKYERGLDCANKIISSDLSTLTADSISESTYTVMFLTDGAPTDDYAGTQLRWVPDTAAPGQPTYDDGIRALMVSKIEAIMDLARRRAAGARFQTINYGADKWRSSTQAQAELTKIKRGLATMSRAGQSENAQVEDASNIAFCELFNSGPKETYSLKRFGIVNLTALARKGSLLADSDMDGIPDRDEEARGFDPQRARSSVKGGTSILDGACPRGKTAAECGATPRVCTKINAMGMADCDLDQLSLMGSGIDDDDDGLPSYVELIKGTSPNDSNDVNSNIDGDALTMLQELLIGRDPWFKDDDAPEENLIKYESQLVPPAEASGCGANQQQWKFHVDHVPIVNTLASLSDDALSSKLEWTRHAAGENVILSYYIVAPSSQGQTVTNPKLLYGQYIKISAGQEVKFDKDGFRKLGTIDTTFRPVQN